jgi:hypothetical protein
MSNVMKKFCNLCKKIQENQLNHIVGTSNTTIWRTLHNENMHPYHYTLSGDYERRLNFGTWLLEIDAQNFTFIERILFAVEANFSRNRVVNLRNIHYWAPNNPHVIRVIHNQHLFSLNVWVRIFGNSLMSPLILPNRLNGNDYLNFLENEITNILDDLPFKSEEMYRICKMGHLLIVIVMLLII